MVYRNGSPLITTLQVQSVNLTWDEYQALPSTKLTDGAYYNITDLTQSTLDIVNTLSGENTLLKARVAELEAKNVYSTDEKVVGTWIDGKPLYRKTIAFGSLPNNTSKTVPLGIDDIDSIASFRTIAVSKTSKVTHSLPEPNTSSTYVILCYINDKQQIYIQTYYNYSSLEAYSTIEYTKTTD